VIDLFYSSINDPLIVSLALIIYLLSCKIEPIYLWPYWAYDH